MPAKKKKITRFEKKKEKKKLTIARGVNVNSTDPVY
jgi:hypothetical protein